MYFIGWYSCNISMVQNNSDVTMANTELLYHKEKN